MTALDQPPSRKDAGDNSLLGAQAGVFGSNLYDGKAAAPQTSKAMDLFAKGSVEQGASGVTALNFSGNPSLDFAAKTADQNTFKFT
jgi:hypothetical protein